MGGTFVKRGTQVVKYWKENGYAVPQELFLKHPVKKVRLYTKYDGVITATKEAFNKYGKLHLFGDEMQIILSLQYWEER